MKYIIFRLLLHPYVFTQLVITSFFTNILALATPLYVMQVLQRYIAYGVNSTLYSLIAGVTIAVTFEFFFRNLRHRIARDLSKENYKIKENFLNKLQGAKSSFGELFKEPRYQRVGRLFQSVENIFSANNTVIILDLPFVVIFLIAVFLINSTLGAITLFIMCLVLLTNLLMSLIIDKTFLETAREQNKEDDFIKNIISNHEIIKIFNYKLIFNKIWINIINVLVPLKEKMLSRFHLSQSIMQTIVGYTTIVIIGVGATIVVAGDLGVGGLIAANILAARAISPLIRYISVRPLLLQGNQNLSELNKLTNVIEERTKGSVIEKFIGNITLEKIEFKYPEQKISLFKDISARVSPGQILVISGNNGSGKTTLIKLLLGSIEPNYGTIAVDKVNLKQLQEPWWRSNVMYLPQESSFLNDSFRNNIFGQNSNIQPNEATNILIQSDLKEFINDQQNGIDALISYNASELPPGIKKKISLARALTSNGQIVIFDEPTESLDRISSSKVYKLINQLHQNKKTIIISSSDPYIIKGATAILYLNSKTGASIFTPKQLEQRQKNFIEIRKNYMKKEAELKKNDIKDDKIEKKKRKQNLKKKLN